jgi:hypothetical protein
MQIEWLDDQFHPVKYSATSGKPPWKFTSDPYEEPENEASDCE